MSEEYQLKRVGRIRRGWLIFKSAWKVLKLDKELAVFTIFGLILGGLVLAVGGILSVILAPNHQFDTNKGLPISVWVVWVAVALLISIASTFMTAAITAGALTRFRGGDPTIRSGLKVAKQHFLPLTALAVLNTGISQALGFIEQRVPFGGRIVTWLLGIAWSVASFFAIAVIVDSAEQVYPIKAVKRSGGLIKEVWREGAVAESSYALIFIPILIILVMAIPIAIVSSAYANAFNGPGSSSVSVAFVIADLAALMLALVIMSTISGIVKAALYYYATTGEAPEQFNRELLRQSFTKKKARKLFA